MIQLYQTKTETRFSYRKQEPKPDSFIGRQEPKPDLVIINKNVFSNRRFTGHTTH